MQRGRKSPNDTQPVGVVEPLVPGVQPAPPQELSPDELVEWNRFIAGSPPDWFPRETWPMLVQLCRHICQSRFFGEALQEVRSGLLDPRDAESVKHIDVLTRLHDREGRAVSALCEKLRLTTQARLPRAD